MPKLPPEADTWMKRLGVPPLIAVVLWFGSELLTELRSIRTDIAIVRATVAPHVPPTAQVRHAR